MNRKLICEKDTNEKHANRKLICEKDTNEKHTNRNLIGEKHVSKKYTNDHINKCDKIVMKAVIDLTDDD